MSRVKGGIEVQAFVTKGSRKLDAFARALAALLADYERAGNGHFAFEVIDADTEHLRERAKAAGLEENEGTAAPRIQSILEQAFPFYQIVSVDLASNAPEIDRALHGLIITRPGIDYTDSELLRIDRFLMRDEKSLACSLPLCGMRGRKPLGRARGSAWTALGHGRRLRKHCSRTGAEMQRALPATLPRTERIRIGA